MPVNDEFTLKEESYVLKKISDRTGRGMDQIKAEWDKRTKLLEKLAEQNIVSHKEVTEIIATYYGPGPDQGWVLNNSRIEVGGWFCR